MFQVGFQLAFQFKNCLYVTKSVRKQEYDIADLEKKPYKLTLA